MTRIEELEQSIDETVEKFRLEINKFKAELEHIKELAELKESNGKWKPALREEYWFRNVYGVIEWCKNGDQDNIDWQYNNIPIFPTKEECEKYWNFRDAVKEKSYEFSKEEWNNSDIPKYSIFYRCYVDEWDICLEWTCRTVGEIYFKTKEDAEYIIDNYKEELLKYWL